MINPALRGDTNVVTQLGCAQIASQQSAIKDSDKSHDEANRDPRPARPTAQLGRRPYLVEQPAIDRCFWTTEDDAALGITKEV